MRSLATRASTLGLSPHARQAVDVCKAAGFDLVIIETPGIGQFGAEVVGHSDVSLYVMTAEYGAASQLEKIDMLDYADVVAINKFDRPGALDALRDVRKQYRRNHRLWSVPDAALPVYGTVASRFNDAGVNRLYLALLDQLRRKTGAALATERDPVDDDRAEHTPIPPERTRYLAEIVEAGRDYGRRVDEQAALARQLYQLDGAIRLLRTDPDAGGGNEAEEVAPELHIADGEDEAPRPPDQPLPPYARAARRTQPGSPRGMAGSEAPLPGRHLRLPGSRPRRWSGACSANRSPARASRA